MVNRNEYVKNVENFLCNIVICDSVGCEMDHRETIDANYVYIKNSMTKATRKYLFKNRRKFVQIPGWNVICSRKYKCARESFLRWLNNGKIRQGELYDEMVNNRKIFIKFLRYCKFSKE